MLKNTFVHIPGIGKNTELEIWQSNVLNWEEFLANHEDVPLSSYKKEMICNHIEKSILNLKEKKHSFFLNIPSNLHWRAYPEMKGKCCFLDIETTGLDKHNHDVTTIGIYDGEKSKILVNGQDLHKFPNEIKKYSMIVTFNGRCFDIPFLQNKFPEADLDKLHVDLRFALKELGYSGGLKRIEKEVGIEREDDLQEVDGWEAVRLWKRYQKGDESALELLKKYNQADIENLKVLMEFAFERLKEKNFLEKM